MCGIFFEITTIISLGNNPLAVLITWNKIGKFPISCKTLGFRDLSLVPFPAAKIMTEIDIKI